MPQWSNSSSDVASKLRSSNVSLAIWADNRRDRLGSATTVPSAIVSSLLVVRLSISVRHSSAVTPSRGALIDSKLTTAVLAF